MKNKYVFGGIIIAVFLVLNMNFRLYISSLLPSLMFYDVLPGIAKTFVFGFIVGIVGSYKGYNAENGTVGVGRASTSSVVIASLLILVVDMVLVKITVTFWPI